MVGRMTRRITTIVLIAALLPVPGLAWNVPPSRRPGVDPSMAAARVFAMALNSVHQSAGTVVRPQIYLVFNVDVPVLNAGNQTLLTATSAGWFEAFLKELMTPPAGGATTTPANLLSSPNATKLAAVPDSLRYNGSADDAESTVRRSVRVALDDALTEAGIDTNQGSLTSEGGTVTYEGQHEDGDIIVTGRVVNGQIVLTKEFKPLATGTENAGQRTIAVNAPEATAVASPAAFNKSYLAEYETKVKLITPNQTNANLMGQISVRDTYVAQMNNMAANFESLLKNPGQMDALVTGLRRDAKAVDDAYQRMLGAERSVIDLQGQNPRVDLKGNYEGDMRRAAQLDMEGNKSAANKIRTDAENTAYGSFVHERQMFFQTLDQNPLLGLGDPGLFGSDYLFKKIRNTLSYDAPNSDYVNLVRPYFEKAATEARSESTRANAINAPEAFVEFGGPKYLRTRDAMDAEGQANGSNLPRALSQAAEGGYESIEGSKAVGTEITNFGLNIVAGTSWVIPGIGPFISAGVAAIQVVRDGKDLVVALLDEKDARNLAGVTGYTRVLTAEDRVAAQRNQFVVSVVGLALEGLSNVKIVKGPLPAKAGHAVENATETAAATAAREAPTPAGAVGDKTQVFPEAPPEPPSLPTRRASDAELDARNIEEAAEMDQAYAENLARARAAGVSEPRIQQLTKKGGGPGHTGAINALYLEALAAEGKELMSLREFMDASMFETKNRLGTLTEADWDWLRKKLAQDPNYLDRIPNRGRMDGTDGFITPISGEQAADLVKNPRVAQMVDDAKSAASARAAAVEDTKGTVILPAGAAIEDAKGTVLVPAGSKPAAPTGAAALEDAKGTMILPAGSKPAAPTGAAALEDAKGTMILPAGSRPAARVDPKAIAGFANELKQTLPKAQQSGLSPAQVARDTRAAMTRLGIEPRELVTQLAQQLLSLPKPVSMTDLGNTTKAAATPGLDVSLEALGISSGEAFKMTAVNHGTAPIQLRGQGIVVEPVIGAPVKQTSGVSRVGMAAPVVTQTIEAFCVERVRPVAPPGTQYRVAPPAMQQQHHGLIDVLHAAQRVQSTGLLHPDSEIKGYFNFVRQWSIWTKQENFDEKKFTEEFLNQTKKNVESQNVKWTDAMQSTVRKAAPGRWRDITSVLDEANKPKIQAAGAPLPSQLLVNPWS